MRIEVIGVAKTYFSGSRPPTKVTEGLSFEANDSEFVCILGPSGCGKTTLLGLMAGLIAPDAGSIRFVGRRTTRGPITTIVWQEYALIPWRTVLDNVAFGLEVRGVPKAERLQEARKHLEMMGIQEFASHLPHQLSGGMRQRVGIARALTNDPEVLLMDEPFAAVDAQTRLVLQEELLSLWSRYRKTVVFITHNIEEALLLGDRVIVLSARPSRVLEDIRVPLARPRTAEIERDPRFIDMKLNIWNRLKQQTVLARGQGDRISSN